MCSEVRQQPTNLTKLLGSIHQGPGSLENIPHRAASC